jgi:hypothetical protein
MDLDLTRGHGSARPEHVIDLIGADLKGQAPVPGGEALTVRGPPAVPYGWVTMPRVPAIRKLVADDGPLQMSLFDEQALAEITSGDFPGERLTSAISACHERVERDGYSTSIRLETHAPGTPWDIPASQPAHQIVITLPLFC